MGKQAAYNCLQLAQLAWIYSLLMKLIMLLLNWIFSYTSQNMNSFLTCVSHRIQSKLPNCLSVETWTAEHCKEWLFYPRSSQRKVWGVRCMRICGQTGRKDRTSSESLVQHSSVRTDMTVFSFFLLWCIFVSEYIVLRTFTVYCGVQLHFQFSWKCECNV